MTTKELVEVLRQIATSVETGTPAELPDIDWEIILV